MIVSEVFVFLLSAFLLFLFSPTMINSYSDFGFYGTGSQPVETQAAVAYRLGGLSLNTGYQNRMVQNGNSTQNYVDSKSYDQMSSHHSGGQVGDNLVKESQSNFKTPGQHPPPPTTTVPGAWNSFNSMRPTTSPASSLTSIQSGDNMRFDPAMAYARSMQNLDMYNACCQSNQVMNPGIHQNILPWVNNMVGEYLVPIVFIFITYLEPFHIMNISSVCVLFIEASSIRLRSTSAKKYDSI